ncbi:MAG: hypothetical protein RIQ62_960 [Bacteroidota bacterium]
MCAENLLLNSMKYLIIYFFVFCVTKVPAQNKMGYTWIVGYNVDFAKFNGTSSLPLTGQKFNASHPSTPMMFTRAHSNICDSLTGNIILSTGGMILYDSAGYIIENGDSLQPTKAYTYNNPAEIPVTQGTIILPKGTENEYYVIIPTVSDSLYDINILNPTGTGKFPFDLLRYNIVDMKQNGGSGKVVQKNKILLRNVELSKVMMQACKHANGIDWWLLKHASYNNTVYRFLVTKDSIYGPYVQSFSEPVWGWFDLYGQSTFSKDGKKYGAVMGKSNKLFLADFDRCSGELSNPKVINIPIDSTTDPYWDNQNARDSLSGGISFSLNGDFVYISKRWNVYQFEVGESDSNLAWYRVVHGFDTTKIAFEGYGQLYRAPDNRIYIGKVGNSFTQFSVIDNPDNKGAACNFCRKCFRIDTADGGLTSPPNMPDYELGPDTTISCWPLIAAEVNGNVQWKIYPNPATDNVTVSYHSAMPLHFSLYNLLGQEMMTYTLPAGVIQKELLLSANLQGLYFYTVSNKHGIITQGKLSCNR